MKILEDLTVYKNQYGYSALLRNDDDKMYINVGFRKGQEPVEEVSKLMITNGFLTFYKDKNGLAKPKIVVLDYFVNDNVNEEAGEIFEGDLPF